MGGIQNKVGLYTSFWGKGMGRCDETVLPDIKAVLDDHHTPSRFNAVIFFLSSFLSAFLRSFLCRPLQQSVADPNVEEFFFFFPHAALLHPDAHVFRLLLSHHGVSLCGGGGLAGSDLKRIKSTNAAWKDDERMADSPSWR